MTDVCCCSCFNILKQNHSEYVAILWRELCALNPTHGPIIQWTGGDNPELRFLEMYGYITTHEFLEYILIKLLGEKQDCMNQSLFCPGGNHV